MTRLGLMLVVFALAACTSESPDAADRLGKPAAPVAEAISESQAIAIARGALEDAGWGGWGVDASELDASLVPSDRGMRWHVRWIDGAAPCGGPVGDVYIDEGSGEVISCEAAGTC